MDGELYSNILGLILFFNVVDSYYRIPIKLFSCIYTICYKMFPFTVTSFILFGGTLLISPLYETFPSIGVGRREWWIQKTGSCVILCLHSTVELLLLQNVSNLQEVSLFPHSKMKENLHLQITSFHRSRQWKYYLAVIFLTLEIQMVSLDKNLFPWHFFKGKQGRRWHCRIRIFFKLLLINCVREGEKLCKELLTKSLAKGLYWQLILLPNEALSCASPFADIHSITPGFLSFHREKMDFSLAPLLALLGFHFIPFQNRWCSLKISCAVTSD